MHLECFRESRKYRHELLHAGWLQRQRVVPTCVIQWRGDSVESFIDHIIRLTVKIDKEYFGYWDVSYIELYLKCCFRNKEGEKKCCIVMVMSISWPQPWRERKTHLNWLCMVKTGHVSRTPPHNSWGALMVQGTSENKKKDQCVRCEQAAVGK